MDIYLTNPYKLSASLDASLDPCLTPAHFRLMAMLSNVSQNLWDVFHVVFISEGEGFNQIEHTILQSGFSSQAMYPPGISLPPFPLAGFCQRMRVLPRRIPGFPFSPNRFSPIIKFPCSGLSILGFSPAGTWCIPIVT